MAKKSLDSTERLDSTESQKHTIRIEEDHLMKEKPEIPEEAALEDMEQVYRDSLMKEPGNHEARAALARCLFMQWIARSAFGAHEVQQDKRMKPSQEDGMQEVEISRVLAECLHHSLTTYYLSPSVSHRVEMKRMQSFVYKAGREAAVANAKRKMDRAAACLMQEMLLDGDSEIQGQTAELNPGGPGCAASFSLYAARRKTAL